MILNSRLYCELDEALKQADCEIFDVQSDERMNTVSESEVVAFVSAVKGYMMWVGQAAEGSSYLKSSWFTAALVAPPMFELCNHSDLKRTYKFDRCVALSRYLYCFR